MAPVSEGRSMTNYFRYTDDQGRTCYGANRALPDGAVELSAEAWQGEIDALRTAALAEPMPAPDRCSKLGLKRALAETGAAAVFKKPEWPAVKAAIEADEGLKEDWDLATMIVRTDPLVQAMIAARKYDTATVDAILVRANILAA